MKLYYEIEILERNFESSDGCIAFDGLHANSGHCSHVLGVKITLTVCLIPCLGRWMRLMSGCCVISTLIPPKMLDEF